MSVFFLCSYPLAKGSIVEPGNWGRILNLYPMAHPENTWMPLRELAFENARLKNFPDKPSRLASIFVCETEADALDFQKTGGRPLDLVYEAEFAAPELPQHRGCLTHFDICKQGTFADLDRVANDYWRAETVQKVEIVSGSAIRIVRRL